jgi:hypothetical protein
MRRRDFLSLAAAGTLPVRRDGPLLVPVQHVLDKRARLYRSSYYWSQIWPEATRDLERCGIRLENTVRSGEIRRSPTGRPIFDGLDRDVINIVLTDHLPMAWDGGRALRGVTTRYDRCHVCVIALNYAHCHQIPLLAVNTCLHELLHVFMHDVFESRPPGFSGQAREFRIDVHATRLWLFRDGGEIRAAADRYVERLRSGLL